MNSAHRHSLIIYNPLQFVTVYVGPFSDSGVGTESISIQPAVYFSVADSGLGLDVPYRVLGEISVDGVALPHVLDVAVSEPAATDTRPVQTGVPYREFLGRLGRRIQLSGWTSSLSDLETLRGYADGQLHMFILPTGTGFRGRVIRVQTPEEADQYGRYNYALEVAESIDS